LSRFWQVHCEIEHKYAIESILGQIEERLVETDCCLRERFRPGITQWWPRLVISSTTSGSCDDVTIANNARGLLTVAVHDLDGKPSFGLEPVEVHLLERDLLRWLLPIVLVGGCDDQLPGGSTVSPTISRPASSVGPSTVLIDRDQFPIPATATRCSLAVISLAAPGVRPSSGAAATAITTAEPASSVSACTGGT
jgi:hypothetical protein